MVAILKQENKKKKRNKGCLRVLGVNSQWSSFNLDQGHLCHDLGPPLHALLVSSSVISTKA